MKQEMKIEEFIPIVNEKKKNRGILEERLDSLKNFRLSRRFCIISLKENDIINFK